MEFIFLNAAGQTLFSRNDMESGHWVQEQMNVTADFPFDAAKKIERGMRIAFRDPATDNIEVFEIRVVVNREPAHIQQITAEHIALSELSDEHINKSEITDQTAAQALATVLTGTLWSVGNNTASGTQNADISRGSVWDAVNTIQDNWNVYITPRVVISTAGSITGRYLDIAPAQGVWRGLRLSIRKNMTDPAVTINDEDVLTALYGYGANVDVPQTSGDDQTEELTFADVVWTATDDHPAKPSGQTYLEWPAKTALYGRNGRPRYGYYQNGNIKDADVLLEKTWEALKKTADPKISINGTVIDLYRLGYQDQPIRLHDLVIVDIEDTGESFQKEIICNDVDLVDATGTRPEIGDYIPNIIYINRDNAKRSGGGGGGGGRGQTNEEDQQIKFESEFIKTDQAIGMVVGMKDGQTYIKTAEIIASINDDGGTHIKLQADTIDIGGVATAFSDYGIVCGSLTSVGSISADQNISCDGTVSGYYGSFENGLDVNGDVDCLDVDCNDIDAAAIVCTSLSVNGNAATWKSFTYRHCGLGTQQTYQDTSGINHIGRLVTSYSDTTISYLG